MIIAFLMFSSCEKTTSNEEDPYFTRVLEDSLNNSGTKVICDTTRASSNTFF